MSITSVSTKTAPYNFEKCNIPSLLDATVYDDKLIASIDDNCSNVLTTFTINNTELSNSYKEYTFDTFRFMNTNEPISFYIKNNKIIGLSGNNLKNYFILKHKDSSQTILDLISNSIKHPQTCIQICGIIYIKSKIIFAIQIEDGNKYLGLLESDTINEDNEIKLTGDFIFKEYINLYRKARLSGFSKKTSNYVEIRSIDFEKNTNNMYILLGLDKKGIVGKLTYFKTLNSFGSNLDILNENCKKLILNNKPMTITSIQKNTIYVLCDHWNQSNDLHCNGFLYYIINI